MIERFSNNLKKIDPWEVLKPVLIRYIPEMVDANQDQLRRGELNDGERLESYKSAVYADFKDSLGTYKAPSGTPDLQLFGDFYDGMYGKVDNDGIELGSRDGKEGVLETNYSVDIFGLQPEEWEQLKEDYIIPEFISSLLLAMFR